MPETIVPELNDGWIERLRQTPAGILLMAAFLVILGFGWLFGGIYLLLANGAVRYWAVVTGLIGGPALLYLAFHLVRLTRWTWLTLIVLLVLMAGSSLIRLAVAPGVGLAPAAELVIEAAAAFYLTRPAIRARFGWRGVR